MGDIPLKAAKNSGRWLISDWVEYPGRSLLEKERNTTTHGPYWSGDGGEGSYRYATLNPHKLTEGMFSSKGQPSFFLTSFKFTAFFTM